MPTLVDMTEKKKPGRRPSPDSKRTAGVDRHTKPRKAFHADQELFDALERFINASRPAPTESECLRIALEEFLAKRGHWPPAQAKL